ncbi:hypothetical protein NPIL_583931 [Nephila pilipes]|uniref:Uncharacterized protein n=1 Tax=Nephila pilipes TaxID=299642 RepID=A0A8X6P2P5_NEPPI|nr:hypothetical protein NPIL_583931 [Nephila pilipes]
MEAPRQSSSWGPVACFWSTNRKQNTLLWAPKKHGAHSEINYLTRNRKLFLGQTRGFEQAKQKRPICAKLADHPRYYQSL